MIGVRKKVKGILVVFMVLSLGMHLWGIQRDLPYSEEIDENFIVRPAVRMAGAGDPNPRWFGNPGSTLLYPLAALYRVWPALGLGKKPYISDSSPTPQFFPLPSSFMAGRVLCMLYALFSIPLLYALGRRVFGVRAALIGCFLFVLLPLPLTHAQMVRTDAPGIFFGLLSLWLCAKVVTDPSLKNQLLAGGAIGLAVATRYFMVALIPILVGVNVLVWMRGEYRVGLLKRAGLGLLAILLGFAISTPYFFLDFETVQQNIFQEARGTHLGSDGFSKAGNFLWYWSASLPKNLTWPILVVSMMGVGFSIWRKRMLQFLMFAFILIFLVGISLSALHWDRWIIQLLPLFTLFAGAGLVAIGRRLKHGAGQKAVWASALLLALLPGYQSVLQNLRQFNPSTRILARKWIIENIPPGSRIDQEWYTAPLGGTEFVTRKALTLSVAGSLEYFRKKGVPYVVVSSAVYARYFAEPSRCAEQVRFYNQLDKEGTLLQEFKPSKTRGGPTIKIYRCIKPGNKGARRPLGL